MKEVFKKHVLDGDTTEKIPRQDFLRQEEKRPFCYSKTVGVRGLRVPQTGGYLLRRPYTWLICDFVSSVVWGFRLRELLRAGDPGGTGVEDVRRGQEWPGTDNKEDRVNRVKENYSRGRPLV